MLKIYGLFMLWVIPSISICATTGSLLVSGDEIKQATQQHLNTLKEPWSDFITLQANHEGKAKTMKLLLTEIHPARQVSKTEYFDCVNFVDVTDPKKVTVYDIDFWFTTKEGKLVIQQGRTELHKINGKKLFDYNADGTKKPPVG